MFVGLAAVFGVFILMCIVSRLALILLLVYTALLLPVLEDFRVVMGDEAAYVDPALRWVDGLGFTSAAWWQSPDQFWAANFPLYAVVSAAWVKLTGWSSLWGVRSLNTLLYVAAMAWWVAGCRRAGWFKSPWQEAGFLALLLGSLYATGPSQYIRPESLGALVMGGALWTQTLVSSRARALGAFLAGAAAVLSGLQFVVALGLFGIVWLLLAKIKAWAAVCWCALGGVSAFAVLLFIYSYFGVLDIFLHSTFGLGSNRAAQWHGWRDPMLWATSAVLAFVVIRRGLPVRAHDLAVAGLAAGFGLAFVLFLLSKYPQYYGFLAILPLSTAVAAIWPSLGRRTRQTAIALLALVGVCGFPLAALMNWNSMPARRHAEVTAWLDSALAGASAVFVDPSAYFASRQSDRTIFTQAVLPFLSSNDKAQIEAVVIIPDHPHRNLQKNVVFALLGGDWNLAETFPLGEIPTSRWSALDALSRLSYAGPYRFELWRRHTGAGSP